MMNIFLNLVFGAVTIAFIILLGVRAYRSMSDKYSHTADEQQTVRLERISGIIVILVGSINVFINVTETKIAEATKIVFMIGLVGLAIFIVFAWDRISARQIDKKGTSKKHK